MYFRYLTVILDYVEPSVSDDSNSDSTFELHSESLSSDGNENCLDGHPLSNENEETVDKEVKEYVNNNNTRDTMCRIPVSESPEIEENLGNNGFNNSSDFFSQTQQYCGTNSCPDFITKHFTLFSIVLIFT